MTFSETDQNKQTLTDLDFLHYTDEKEYGDWNGEDLNELKLNLWLNLPKTNEEFWKQNATNIDKCKAEMSERRDSDKLSTFFTLLEELWPVDKYRKSEKEIKNNKKKYTNSINDLISIRTYITGLPDWPNKELLKSDRLFFNWQKIINYYFPKIKDNSEEIKNQNINHTIETANKELEELLNIYDLPHNLKTYIKRIESMKQIWNFDQVLMIALYEITWINWVETTIKQKNGSVEIIKANISYEKPHQDPTWAMLFNKLNYLKKTEMEINREDKTITITQTSQSNKTKSVTFESDWSNWVHITSKDKLNPEHPFATMENISNFYKTLNKYTLLMAKWSNKGQWEIKIEWKEKENIKPVFYGTVERFDTTKWIGFGMTDEGNTFMINYTDLPIKNYDFVIPTEGERVSFNIEHTKRGPMAKNIKIFNPRLLTLK